MAVQGTVNISAMVGGFSIEGVISRSDEGAIGTLSVELERAKVGTLSTRTNDTSGELTMEADHGITEGEVLDIGWVDVNGDFQIAYEATAGTVSTLDVLITGATAGTVLPAQGYDITAQVRSEQNCEFDGDHASLIICKMNQNGHVVFEDVGDAVLKAHKLLKDEVAWWVENGFTALPITGNAVHQLQLTNLDGVNAALFQLMGLKDPTP